jgi:hypothetical protein
MSTDPQVLIWFQLVDSETGQPYQNSSCSSVLRSSLVVPVVDQFCKAVKAEYSNKLASVDAGDLVVYKNKAVFHTRNAMINGEFEKPLHPTDSLESLGCKEELLIVAVPSSTRNTPELVQLNEEIKELETSEEYKTLAYKNRVWAYPKPTEQEKIEWQLLNKKLADLKKNKDSYQNAIPSMIAHSAKICDTTRKGYKRNTAIKDERLLLSDVASLKWKQFRFKCRYKNPTFGDFQRASGFRNEDDVRNYFLKREKGKIKENKIKSSLTEDEWIFLMNLNQRVNALLHSTLETKEDGCRQLVLEHEIYEVAVNVAEKLVLWLYPKQMVDIKDAASDSSNSP